MREKRNIISLDTDSALALMQEIYNDIVEQRNTASMITKKMLTFMKDAEDMSVIGPVIKEQQKILNDCTEKKISLVKLQSALLKQMNGSGPNAVGGKLQLTEDDRVLLEKLMQEPDGDSQLFRSNCFEHIDGYNMQTLLDSARATRIVAPVDCEQKDQEQYSNDLLNHTLLYSASVDGVHTTDGQRPYIQEDD
jgi:hypothetical protein